MNAGIETKGFPAGMIIAQFKVGDGSQGESHRSTKDGTGHREPANRTGGFPL